MTDQDFKIKLQSGEFKQPIHKAYAVLIYYSAVRRLEALRACGKQFTFNKKSLVFEVGKRLKHGIETPPLPMPLELPFMDCLVECVKDSNKDFRVFDFSPATAYNIFDRLGCYPHYYRLNRITQFFLDGWTIPQVRSWTGLSLTALNFYIGMVDVAKMGESLKKIH